MVLKNSFMNNLGGFKIAQYPTSSKVQGSGSQTLPVDRALQSERPMMQRLGPMVGLMEEGMEWGKAVQRTIHL